MFDDQKTIKQILSQAENIYSLEGNNRIVLVYQDERLYTSGPFGLSYKPLSDIAEIVHNADLQAYEVFWKA